MMLDESNGESTFEFVDKKVEGMSLVENVPKQDRPSGLSTGSSSNISPVVLADRPSGLSTGSSSLMPSEPAVLAPPTSVPYLSAVAPPSALPSFVPQVTAGISTASTSSAMMPLSGSMNSPPVVLRASMTIASSVASATTPVNMSPTPTSSSSSSSDVFHPTTFSPVIPASKGGNQPYDISPINVESEAGGGAGLISWMKGAVGSGGQILSKVAEKAKNSVDSMITTLDPQMRDFLYSGGSVSIVIASEQEVIIHPIRDAFQSVFGKATVVGLPVDISKVAAAQPVGFTAGIKAAEEKLTALRTSHKLPPDQAILAVENVVVEIGENKWFDVSVLLLNDPIRNVTLEAFTQMTPIPPAVVGMAQEDTPAEYPLRWSGLSVTISSIMASNLQVAPTEWHLAFMGVSHCELLTTAARMLAGLYKSCIGPAL